MNMTLGASLEGKQIFKLIAVFVSLFFKKKKRELHHCDLCNIKPTVID